MDCSLPGTVSVVRYRPVGGQFQPDRWLREPQKVSYCSSSMCWVPLGPSLACLCLPFVSARFSFSPSPPPIPNQSQYLPRHRREVSQSEAPNRPWSEDRPLPGTVRHRRGQVSSESPFQGPTGPCFSGLVGSPLSRPHLPAEDGPWSLFSSSTPSLSDLGQLTSPLCDCFRPLKNKTITPTHRTAGSTNGKTVFPKPQSFNFQSQLLPYLPITCSILYLVLVTKSALNRLIL